MDVYLYYNRKFDELEMYQRLIQYWSMTFGCEEEIHILDNMNFNISIFPPVVTATEIDLLQKVEPGYTSPDGYAEMNRLIRQLEYTRLVKQEPGRIATISRIVKEAGIGCGNGCTNVMNGILHTVSQLARAKKIGTTDIPEIVLALPNYTVYDAQISNLRGAVRPKYIHAKRENNFLPLYNEVCHAVTKQTAAVVITYPNNPAQSTYEGKNVEELKKIVSFCQENEIFLIVDNIYQDVIFPIGRTFYEIFNLTDSTRYVVKIYGSSKDTPFYSGHRTGYWFGDPALSEIYKYHISSTENSLNTYSLVFFALNLYFKLKNLQGTQPTLEDMAFFNQGIFGWNRKSNDRELLERFCEMNLLEKYKTRIQQANQIQEETIKKVTAFVKESRVFCDYTNQDIGNVMFIKVNPVYFDQGDDDLFRFLFYKAKCAVLPGNVFGIQKGSGEVWFRITLLHDTCENIIHNLGRIEEFLIKRKNNDKKD